MKRYDLRQLKADFLPRLGELVRGDLSDGEVGIFLFEVGDFSNIQKSADFVKENNWTLMNSLRFNELDWTIVVKKSPPKIAENVESNESIKSSESSGI
ncbi:hypothetical protein CCY99_01970 [Helicobacter sp. 16-1353]|uniref:NADH-ubiquinone oxidoreductase subunit E family protein n=1 Tax=Helicobacter sp. 16-1353 TaxID=2004996 RepID=UPI000DCE901F|nr:NADH-ubiquinone oxidoreductase subunit E family protein [Helicobacter sp. 16-1353]RAX54934.1 hypothetical protein CCY99_01970 [Helicobacter sp. 16-1353]